ncbi:hypothetical protein BP6252_02928 [Coleophoma cylindrospora]|uniref:Yeast cell wall synthesis Kre9/Knh1-like N-terminal domain-containing protein n=1 Tax=Coleophoma cylindrospora TaxID=1849047 RepID=A0A3D8S6D2_9HELO|nr:hypothetical protein BP6252_02928 [Coleophoma cylindrospora]
MYLSKVILAMAYFVTIYASKVAITNLDLRNISVGAPFRITWAYNLGPITLELVNGPINNQQYVQTIASNVTDESYNWTPSNVPSGLYAFKITDPSNADHDTSDKVNLSEQFNITGGSPASSSTPTSTSSSVQPTGLSSNSKIIITTVVLAIGVVIALCIGLWIRHLRQKKSRGNHRPRTMATDAMRKRNISQSQNFIAPLTPNKTHFAFSTRELPQKPGSRRSAEYETIFDEEALKVEAQAETPWSSSTTLTQVNCSSNSPRVKSRDLASQEPESPTPKTRQLAPESSNLLARFNVAPELEDNDQNIIELSAGTPRNFRSHMYLTDPNH